MTTKPQVDVTLRIEADSTREAAKKAMAVVQRAQIMDGVRFGSVQLAITQPEIDPDG